MLTSRMTFDFHSARSSSPKPVPTPDPLTPEVVLSSRVRRASRPRDNGSKTVSQLVCLQCLAHAFQRPESQGSCFHAFARSRCALRRQSESQPLCFHADARSFVKTPGVGGWVIIVTQVGLAHERGSGDKSYGPMQHARQTRSCEKIRGRSEGFAASKPEVSQP
jgi:hypothetical protein